MTTDPGLNVAAEIASLRGDMREEFQRLHGRLDVIASKHERTDKDTEAIKARVSVLESNRMPWGLLTSVATVGAALGSMGMLFR